MWWPNRQPERTLLASPEAAVTPAEFLQKCRLSNQQPFSNVLCSLETMVMACKKFTAYFVQAFLEPSRADKSMPTADDNLNVIRDAWHTFSFRISLLRLLHRCFDVNVTLTLKNYLCTIPGVPVAALMCAMLMAKLSWSCCPSCPSPMHSVRMIYRQVWTPCRTLMPQSQMYAACADSPGKCAAAECSPHGYTDDARCDLRHRTGRWITLFCSHV